MPGKSRQQRPETDHVSTETPRVVTPTSLNISLTEPERSNAFLKHQSLDAYVNRIICSEWCILHHDPAHDTDDRVCEVLKTGRYQLGSTQDLMERPGLIWRELVTDKEVHQLLRPGPQFLDTRIVMAHILKLDEIVQAYRRFIDKRDQLGLLARQVVKDELKDGGLARWDILMRTCASHSHSIFEYLTRHVERLEDDWIVKPLTARMQLHYSHPGGTFYTRREMVAFARVVNEKWMMIDQARLSHDLKNAEYLAQLNADVRERLSHATTKFLKHRPEVLRSELLTSCFRLPYNCVIKSSLSVASSKGAIPVFTWPDVEEQRRKLSLAWRQENL
ncbi:uncharacterized protein PV06_05175 [Exophiala oligosperma]|uniref:Uncharacterized protein n=2 Tax=Chaetothyriales TaxID=34395 RepID=A0A0D2C2Z0_9EURO|nr:uncharacterized protein PV06_05175 [Exophiala oligosperma]KAJ9644190.1 hypothetical protein H2204_001541 [Knufia peltigerae]KIW44142.1 hypothetical protein PV06_05175 [Exophiala oligosperma]